MPSKQPNSTEKGFLEYIALVVTIILILIGLRVDIRRYGGELKTNEYVAKVTVPLAHFWNDKVVPFLTGKTFGHLKGELDARTTLPE